MHSLRNVPEAEYFKKALPGTQPFNFFSVSEDLPGLISIIGTLWILIPANARG